ncbi:MAG TPA: porin [Thermoanaerobaculia bacterium]|nr:porin [Thermoanaerobaculia bacterium]
MWFRRGLALALLLFGSWNARAQAIKLTGYVQLDAREDTRELDLRRVRLAFSGSPAKRISYFAMLETDHWHPLSTRFVDLSVDLKLSDALKVRAGQFKYDFDIEGREAAHLIPFIDRAFVTNAVSGSLDGRSTPSSTRSAFRDRGVSVISDTKRWGWAVGVFQGAGRGEDDDHNFGTTANLRLKPRDGVVINTGIIASDENDFRAWTGGASWDVNARLLVRGEVYAGSRRTSDVRGGYISTAFTILPSLDLLARVQHIDDEQFADGDASSVDIGAKWYLRRKDKRSGTSLAINYMHRDSRAAFAREAVLAVRMQVRF